MALKTAEFFQGHTGTQGKVSFVYANECHRLQDKMDHLTKFPRTENRIDYQVHMNLKMDSEKGNLEVTKVILEHNQLLTNRY